MSVDPKILETIPFFKDLKLEELQEFASLLNPMAVRKGDIVFRKGTPALTFFIVYNGRFEITAENIEPISVDTKGEIFGWSTVVAPFQYMATVTALTDGELLHILSHDFITLIQGDNELGEKVVNKINQIATKRRAALSGSK